MSFATNLYTQRREAITGFLGQFVELLTKKKICIFPTQRVRHTLGIKSSCPLLKSSDEAYGHSNEVISRMQSCLMSKLASWYPSAGSQCSCYIETPCATLYGRGGLCFMLLDPFSSHNRNPAIISNKGKGEPGFHAGLVHYVTNRSEEKEMETKGIFAIL